MDRRQSLKLLAASALALAPLRSLRAAPRPSKVVVIGAGIMGAAIGYELAKRGAQVTILERAAPASGTTGDSFAYLNASTKVASRPYFGLNWLGLAGWRIWEHETGAALPLQWGGAVYWRDDAERAGQLASSVKTLQQWGYDAEPAALDDVRRLLPSVEVADVSGGAFYSEEGAVDPVGAVDALLARATRHGARVIHPAEVVDFAVSAGRVARVRTRDAEFPADTVVVAAGLGSQQLAQRLDVRLPLKPSSGVLLHTQPQPRLLDKVVFAPGSSFRQTLDGRIVGSSSHEGAPSGLDAEDAGRRILAAASRYLPQIRNAAIARVSVGQRVVPADTFPVAGFAPKVGNVYVAVTHSGITLAPVLARWAAAEILDGISVDLLDGFRPQRFA